MENRERDRVSQRTTPTDAGQVNRRTEEAKGHHDGSTVEFGQHIGEAENAGGSDDNDNDTIGRSTEGRH